MLGSVCFVLWAELRDGQARKMCRVMISFSQGFFFFDKRPLGRGQELRRSHKQGIIEGPLLLFSK